MSAIEAEIRKVVLAVLAERADEDGIYSSKHPPPDLCKERFHREVRNCPGARKLGRMWTVPKEAWRAYRWLDAVDAPIADPDAPEAVAARMLGQSHRVSP